MVVRVDSVLEKLIARFARIIFVGIDAVVNDPYAVRLHIEKAQYILPGFFRDSDYCISYFNRCFLHPTRKS